MNSSDLRSIEGYCNSGLNIYVTIITSCTLHIKNNPSNITIDPVIANTEISKCSHILACSLTIFPVIFKFYVLLSQTTDS